MNAPKNPLKQEELLAICNGQGSDKERWLAASNPCLSSSILLDLLHSSDQVLRDGAAANPALTNDIVRQARLHHDCEAWLYIVDNPAIDLSLLQEMLVACRDPYILNRLQHRALG